jgi:hypothetical protein
MATTKPLISLTFNEVASFFRTKKLSEDFIATAREHYVSGRSLVKIAEGVVTFADYNVDVQKLLGSQAAVEELVLDLKEYSKNGVPLDLLVS